MQRLYLNGLEVDLPPKKVSLNFQINDLADIKDRNLHYTNRFKLPITPRNIKVMQYLGVPGSKSRKPYEVITAKYVYNGVELMPTGYAKVNLAQGTGYDVTIYDGNASLYETIKGRKINELNYEDLNHALNGTTHLASLDHTSGYIYALMYSGFSTVSGLVNSERQVAAVYKHTLWNKIFNEAGFTYSGAIFSNADFLSEVVLPTIGYDVVGEETTETAKGSTTSNVISKSEYQLQDPEYEEEQFNLTDVGLIGLSVQSGNILQFDVAALYRVNLSIDWELVTGECFINGRLNGNTGAGTFIFPIGSGTEVIEMYIQAEAGDQIEYWVNSHAIPGAPAKFQIDFTTDITATYTLVTGGLIVKFEDIMPEVSQADFIKDVMQTYGLIFQARKNSRHYDFVTMEALVNDRANAQDWSDKLISAGQETYTIGGYAQNNYMLFNYPGQDVQDITHDGNLQAQHFNIKDDGTLFTSIYEISNKEQTRNTYPIYGAILWEEKIEQEATVVNNLVSKFRTFKLNYIDEAVTFKFGDIVGNYSRSDNMPFLSLDNVGYEYNIAIYYPGFKRILDAQKKRAIMALMKPSDIYNLDFLSLKYFKQLGQYYYLNKVRSFIDGQPTKIDIIQVNELTVNKPPSQLGTKVINLTHGSGGNIPLAYFMVTAPPYTDPEYDQPETIKFTAGWDPEIIVKNKGVAITDSTPFDVSDMSVTVEDQGGDPLAHSATLDFTIQSFNNPNFSDQTGTIEINVAAEVNQAPIAEAGPNSSMPYDSNSGPQNVVLNISGAGSYDPNGDALTYLWTADQLPNAVILSNETAETCTLTGTGLTGLESGYVITMTLQVWDPALLTDSDTMIVTIIDLDNPPI